MRQSHESEARKETHFNIKTFALIEETNLCMTVTQTNEWPDNRNHRLVTVRLSVSKIQFRPAGGQGSLREKIAKWLTADTTTRHSGPRSDKDRVLWASEIYHWHDFGLFFCVGITGIWMLNHIWSYSVVPHLIFLSQKSNVQKNHQSQIDNVLGFVIVMFYMTQCSEL